MFQVTGFAYKREVSTAAACNLLDLRHRWCGRYGGVLYESFSGTSEVNYANKAIYFQFNMEGLHSV